MRALVVYESMFGNTRSIAEGIADGLRSRMDVELVEVGAAPDQLGPDVDLVVVGGPTHAFGMSRPSTRRSAAEQADAPLLSAGRGIREWLASAALPERLLAATFDTKAVRPRLPGSAGNKAARRLRRRGCRVVASAHFWVAGVQGPLVDDEVARARGWAADRLAPAAV